MTWQQVISLLNLTAHPEGGFYRETFRDPAGDTQGRAHSTAIYFLLPHGIVSRWHRVDAPEAWHWYAGAPLLLSQTDGNTSPNASAEEHFTLGNNLAAGERPQHVIPASVWQQARSLGAWTLVGCTVAPGFQFDGFELAPAPPPA